MAKLGGRPPEWIHMIDQALEDLKALDDVTLLGVGDVAALFAVHHSTARRIIKACDLEESVGKQYVVERPRLIQALATFRDRASVACELERRKAFKDALEEMRKTDKAKARKIEERELQSVGLPPGVKANGARLTIDYTSPDDLLAKLLQLARSAALDIDAFEEAVEPQDDLDGRRDNNTP